MGLFKDFKYILTGNRNSTDGLWDIPLTRPKHLTTQKLNVIIPKKQNLTSLLQYLYASLFSLTKTTLLQAIRNGNLATWPGLTTNNVNKYLPEMPATVLGHLDQSRKGFSQQNKALPPAPTISVHHKSCHLPIK